MQFEKTYLITNMIGMFWRNTTKRGSYYINLLLFTRYGSQIMGDDNTNNNYTDRGRVIGTDNENRLVRSLI